LLPKPKSSEKKTETVIRRSSRRHDDEGHGGAWKVAFADFSLALMCLFLVLWVMAARNQERIQQVLLTPGGSVLDEGQGFKPETMGGPRGSLLDREPVPQRGAAQAPGNAAGSGGSAGIDNQDAGAKANYETPAQQQALARMLAMLAEEAGLAGNLHTVVTPQGLRVMLHDTDRQGMFERGSAAPGERFARLLRRMGPLFAQMRNQLLIVGHTDAVPFAGHDAGVVSNWSLSSERALAARAQLLAGGMPVDGILQVIGMADRAPIDTRDAAAGINRRIELVVLTDAQARAIAAMSGTPAAVQPLAPDVDAAVTDPGALQALRARLFPSRTQPQTAAQAAR
jgi:chemotaxis protein MotB